MYFLEAPIFNGEDDVSLTRKSFQQNKLFKAFTMSYLTGSTSTVTSVEFQLFFCRLA